MILAAALLVVAGIVGTVIAVTGGDDDSVVSPTKDTAESGPAETGPDETDPVATGPDSTAPEESDPEPTEATQPDSTSPSTTTRPTLPPVTLPPPETEPEDTVEDTEPEEEVLEPTVTGVAGETLSLQTDATVIDATLLAIADPALLDEDRASDGIRVVAVQMLLVNAGDEDYSDAPLLGAFMVDDAGSQIESSFFTRTTEGLPFEDVRIHPGDMRRGWVTFEVPTSATLTAFRWATDLGFGDEVAEWDLATSAEPAAAPALTPGGVPFGEPATLAVDDTEIEIRAPQLIDPATPIEGDAEDVPTGFHALAVEIQHVNLGDAAYDNDPSQGVALVDAAGHQVASAFLSVTEGQGFDGTLTLGPGDSLQGLIVFLVPDGFVPAKLQVSLDYGFSIEWAEFDIG